MMVTLLYVAILVMAFYYLFYQRDNIQLPAPKSWPIIGNVYHLSQFPWHIIHKWNRTFNGVYKFYRFGIPVVVVGSYKAIHEVLVSRGKVFAGKGINGLKLSLLGFPSYWEPDRCWNLFRKVSMKHIKQFCTGLKTQADSGKMIHDDLLQRFASHNGQPLFPRAPLIKSLASTSVKALIGRKDAVSEELFCLLEDVTQLGMDLLQTFGALPDMLKYRICLLFNSRVRRIGMEMQKKGKVLVTKMDKEFADACHQEHSLIKALYDMVKEGLLDKESVKSRVFTLLLGSSASTLPSLVAFVNYMGYNKTFARKIQEEVDRVIGNRAPSVTDKTKMPYTRATIFELLRLFSRFIPQHYAVEDTYIGDVKIPRGTEVFINLWSLLHDESFWSNPLEFKPEHFLDSSGNLLPPDHEARKRLLVFGAGPGVCVGEVLAMDRLFLMMTSLVQGFEVELPESKLYCDPRDQPLGPLYIPPDFMVMMKARHH